MKRTFFVCIALLALAALTLSGASARAELISIAELREQAQAMGRWTKTYQAHGRTIDVDIPIIVPDVERFPVLKAEYMPPFTEEVLERIAQSMDYDGEYYTGTLAGDEFDGVRAGDTLRLRVSPYDGHVWIEYNREQMKEDMPVGSEARRHQYLPWDIDPDTAHAEDNPLTYGEAERIAQRFVDGVYPEGEATVRMIYAMDKRRKIGTETLIKGCLPGAYDLYMSQVFRGIPLLAKVSLARYQGDIVYLDGGTHPAMGQLLLTIHSESAVQFIAFGMLRECARPVSDVPLAPLADVIAAIEPEIEAGHIRRVYSLELGYTAYRDDVDDSFCWLYPTWLLRCEFLDDADEEPDARMDWGDFIGGRWHDRDIYIPAQSAELWHWNYASGSRDTQEDFYPCPEIIRWDDAE